METKTGIVLREIGRRPGLQDIEVTVEGQVGRAVAYEGYSGLVQAGDQVLLNTTAASLNLGSGGRDFVIVNLSRPKMELTGSGHIMKMRYTPGQIRVLSVEEEDSPYHQLMKSIDDLAGTPVLVGTLHSMVAPLCACLALKNRKVAYVMTDAASLPASWSATIYQLKELGLLTGVVTAGNAWGGDIEAVNIFSGLLAAYGVWKPDIILVAMGPGIVGTGTKWGFTGIEQGTILNAVDTLGGIPVAVPRISFADSRARHCGISHHTLTVLNEVCKVRVHLPLPALPGAAGIFLERQVAEHDLQSKHHLEYLDGQLVDKALEFYQLKTTTMGRGKDEDYEFFLALGAAAELSCREELGPA